MIRSIFWKEFREQRLIAIFLPVFAALIAFVAPFIADNVRIPHEDVTSINQTVLLMFALGCGLVTGAQHWAAEKESGTLVLLDLQPCRRKSIWWAKSAYCLLQWFLQMLAIAIVATIVSALPTVLDNIAYPIILFVVVWSFISMCWSLWASSRTKTPLAAIGWGLAAALVAPWLLALTSQLIFGSGMAFVGRVVLAVSAIALMPVLPLALSYRSITALDRTRLQSGDGLIVSQRFPAFRTGWRLAWVDARSLLIPFAACIVVNTLFLSTDPIMLWLVVASIMGVIAGISATDQEQSQKTMQLWADQRLPIATLWSAKLLNRLFLLIAGMVLALCLKVAILYYYSSQTADRYSDEITLVTLIMSANYSLTLIAFAPLTGFSVGMLLGLVSPKKIIGLLVAVAVSLTILTFWLPMIGSGGLKITQWIGLPIVFGLLARWLLWPWSTGHLKPRFILIALLAPLLFTGCYWFTVEKMRVFSVTYVPEPFNTKAFLSETQTTRASQAADKLTEIAKEMEQMRPNFIYMLNTSEPSLTIHHRPPDIIDYKEYDREYDEALKSGWAVTSPQFRSTIDRFYKGNWPAALESIADVEVIPFEDLSQAEGYTELLKNHNKRASLGFAIQLLLMDGLKQESEGHFDESIHRFRQALLLTRQMGHRAGRFSLERNVLIGIHTWLSGRTQKSDLPQLKKMLTLLSEHDIKRPTSEEQAKCNYLSTLHDTVDSSQFWDNYLRISPVNALPNAPGVLIAREIWLTAIDTKDEVARRKAIYDVFMAGVLKASQADYPTLYQFDATEVFKTNQAYNQRRWTRDLYVMDWITPLQENPTPQSNMEDWIQISRLMASDVVLQMTVRTVRQYPRNAFQLETLIEMLKISIALRGHRIEHGEYPKTLSELEPAWFAKLPDNPLTLKPFEYEMKEDRVFLHAPDPFITGLRARLVFDSFEFPNMNQQKPLILSLPLFEVK